MHDNARGGNDALTGGDGSAIIVPRSATPASWTATARGGNDTLIGGVGLSGPTSSMSYGDASEMHDNARGGNDHADRRRRGVRQPRSSATPASWMATAAAAMTR